MTIIKNAILFLTFAVLYTCIYLMFSSMSDKIQAQSITDYAFVLFCCSPFIVVAGGLTVAEIQERRS